MGNVVQHQDTSVIDRGTLANSFLGDTTQVCVVTDDLDRTLAEFVQLGVGPWSIYTFGPHNTTDQTYRGEPSPYSMRIGLASTGTSRWEVIQPLEGRTIYRDWIDEHGKTVQHVVQTCAPLDFEAKIAEFERRGFPVIQSGTWAGLVRFAYFDTAPLIGVAIEVSSYPADAVFPAPEAWYPAAP